MNIKTLGRLLIHPNVVLLSIALVTGTAGASLAHNYLEKRAQATDQVLSRRYEARAVVVAGRDIEAGEPLSRSAMALRNIPRDFIPSGAVTADQASVLLGQRSARALHRGDPLTSYSVQAPLRSLAALVPPGWRALTLSVDEVNAHAGLLRAGDKIDLFYSQSQGATGSTLTLLLDKVPVLATGATLAQASIVRAGEEASSFSSLTLLVTAEEAARIVLAGQTGALTVVLRSIDDTAATVLKTRSSQLLVSTPSSATHSTRTSSERVEVLLGGAGVVR